MQMKKKRATRNPRNRATEEAAETLRAIRDGAVDAFVIQESDGHRVYTLDDADLPYSALAERMQQGAAMLDAEGKLIYCNPSLAKLLGVERETVIGKPLLSLLGAEDRSEGEKVLHEAQLGSVEAEMNLCRADGTLVSAQFSFRLLSQNKLATGVLITDLTPQKEQAKLASRMQSLQDEERRRLARELHDSVGQLLVAIGMNLAAVRQEAQKVTPKAAKLMEENATMLEEINKQIRTISHLLHPPLLDEVGLPSALRWYINGFAQRSKISATLDIPRGFDRLPREMEIVIFRAVQECLSNVHRHSGSSSCEVKVVRRKTHVQLEVKDAGRGIPAAKQANLPSAGGVGLRGMQERLRNLGGTLEIRADSHGTTVTATLPIPQESAATSEVA
jgi:PAS domain S-box-containing protein